MLPPGLAPERLRVAFCDLDGTILDGGRPIPGAVEAIARVQATGLRCVVATGRMYTSARAIAEGLGIDGPLVCYQGALVQDAESGQVYAHRPLSPETARALIAAVIDAGHHAKAFRDEAVYVAEENEDALRYVGNAQVPLHVVGDLVAWVDRPVTKLVVTGPPEAMDRLKERLVERFADEAFIAKSLPHYLEMAAPTVSKATGADVVAALLGIDAAEAVAFGDGENDLELIDWAGFGVAVGGGFPTLLERADWVCPPVTERGVPRTLDAIAAVRERAAGLVVDGAWRSA